MSEKEIYLQTQMSCINILKESIYRQQIYIKKLLEDVRSKCSHTNYKLANYDEWSGQWWECEICQHYEQGHGQPGGNPPKPKQLKPNNDGEY